MADLILVPQVVGNFPSGASYNVNQFATAFAQRLQLTIPSGTVFFGQLGGTEPTSPLPGNGDTPGLWFAGNMILTWSSDNAKYLPLPPTAGQLIGGTLFLTEFACGAHTANTVLTTPDKSGTIATLDDVIGSAGTQTPTAAASVTIDWTKKQTVYLVLGQNTTLAQSGGVDGQEQEFWLENSGTAYTVTWNGIIWPNATSPVMTTSTAGTRKIDHYKLNQVGSLLFGEVLANKTGNADYVGAAAAYTITSGSIGSDTTPPTVVSLTGQTSSIVVTFSELLQGGAIPVADLIVKLTGVSKTINSAVTSGSTLTIQIATTFTASTNVTVQYVGASIKDISGNLAAAFGPSHVTVTSGGGGGSGGGGTGGGGGGGVGGGHVPPFPPY